MCICVVSGARREDDKRDADSPGGGWAKEVGKQMRSVARG